MIACSFLGRYTRHNLLNSRWLVQGGCAQLLQGLTSHMRDATSNSNEEHSLAAANLNNTDLASRWAWGQSQSCMGLALRKQSVIWTIENWESRNGTSHELLALDFLWEKSLLFLLLESNLWRLWCSYTLKLQQQMAIAIADTFPLSTDQDRILSISEDLVKTAGDFKDLAQRAIHHLCTGLVSQFRCVQHIISIDSTCK